MQIVERTTTLLFSAACWVYGAYEEETDEPTWRASARPWLVIPILYTLAIVILAHVLEPVYRRLLANSYLFKRMVVMYFGTREVPRPRLPQFMILVGIGQLIGSLVEVCLWVIRVSGVRDKGIIDTMERSLACFFMLHTFLLLLMESFKLKFMGVAELVDALTVPQMLLGCRCGWLSLGFLRSYRALVTYERLEHMHKLGIIHFLTSVSELTHRLILTLLRFLALIVIYAGLVMVFEILGDLEFLLNVKFCDTAMGEVSFFTMVYWVFETVTTVGYGEYTPKTTISRAVTIGCMMSGVVFCAVEAANLAGTWAERSRGTGSYKGSGRHVRHVVLMGGSVQHLDESLLVAFFCELYHPAYREMWPEAVVLVCTEEAVHRMQDFINVHVEGEAAEMVIVLQGSPLLQKDILRCKCDEAEIVYVMADTSGRSGLDAHEEDKQNILRALSLKRVVPSAPMRLLLLGAEAKGLAVDANVGEWRCYAIKEMRDCLFWQSCHCIGWSTMLCNIMVTTDDREVEMIRTGSSSGRVSRWREDYAYGLSFEVYGFLPATRFIGKSYLELVATAYKEESILVLAAEVNGRVAIAPFRDMQSIKRDTILFALAKDDTDLNRLRCNEEQDWNALFRSRNVSISRGASYDDEPRDPTAHEIQKSQLRKGRTRMSYLSKVRSMSSLHVQHQSNKHASISTEVMLAFEEHTHNIRYHGNCNPFVTFIELSKSWKQIGFFIKESRREWLPVKSPLIILCQTMPTVGFIQDLNLMGDDQVGFIIGSPNWVPDLNRAGIQEAAFIVCPALDQPMHNKNAEEMAMVDGESVMLYQMLDTLGVTQKAKVLFEFKRIHNIGLLPGSNHQPRDFRCKESNGDEAPEAPHDDTESDGENGIMRNFVYTLSRDCSRNSREAYATEEGKIRVDRDSHDYMPVRNGQHRYHLPYLCSKIPGTGLCKRLVGMLNAEGPQRHTFGATLSGNPKVISGQVFVPVTVGSMLARTSYTPGVMQVMQALVMPAETGDMFVWQIRTEERRAGRSFSECWSELLRDHDGPALALGLYRLLLPEEPDGEEEPPIGYVMTSPAKSAMLRITELLFW